MGYQSINEIEQFSFEDCEIKKFEISEELLRFQLEALIVKPNNSQNANYIESYAGTTELQLINGKLLSGIKIGYKYYDANEILLNEVPDEILTEAQLKDLYASCEGAYLYSMDKLKEENGLLYYTLGIELPSEDQYDNINPESYELRVCFEKSIFSWECYMNRVQR